jgi:hypothetical protein
MTTGGKHLNVITVVIEGAARDIRLGMELAGGRVVAASLGDKIEELDRLVERRLAKRELTKQHTRRKAD